MKIPGLWKLRKAVPADCCTVLAAGSAAGALGGIGIIPWWTALLLAAAGFILFERRPAVCMTVGIAAALISGIFYSSGKLAREQEYSASAGVRGIVTVRDSRATKVEGVALESRIRAEFYGSGKESSCPVLLILPESVREKGSLYGDRWQITGFLSVPQSSGFYFDGNGIGGTLPPPYGEAYLLEAAEVEALPAEKSFKRRCFLLRETLLKALTSRVDDSSKSMAARLFLGASDGAPPGIKRNFVLAGIIHLFAVSGMHVAVLAAVAGLCLVFLPFRIRYLVLAMVTTIYVLCSGMAVPALRAGLMIVVWALLRGFLYHTPNWNVLMISFTLFCICDPSGITGLGAQYSYGITAALIAGLSWLQRWHSSGRRMDDLMMNNSAVTLKYRKHQRRIFKVAICCAVAVLAFVSGTMLTMLNQKYFLPGSILSNMAAALLTPLMFAAFIVKMFAGAWCGWVDSFCAWFIECGFEYLRIISELSLEIIPPLSSGMPAAAAAVVFYILLFAGLKLKNFYASLCSMVLALLIMLAFPLLSKRQTETLMVIGGSSSHVPLIAWMVPQESRAVVCNLPDSWSGALAADELLRSGCLEAELYFSDGKSGNNAGVKSFASRIAVKRINLPIGKPTPYFLRNMADEQLDIPVPEMLSDRSRQPQICGGKAFQWSFAEGHNVSAQVTDDGWIIKWQKPDKTVTVTRMPYCNYALLWKSGKKAGIKAGND